MLITELLDVVARRLTEETYALPPDNWLNDRVDESLSLRRDKQLLWIARQQACQLEQMSTQLASLRGTLGERKAADKTKSILMNCQQVSGEQA